MFTDHFGLHGEPFSLSPDPAFLYLSPDHEEALAALRVALQSGRGLTTMIGEVGTGKTTLLNALLASLGPEVRVAYLSNTRLSFADLLHEALRRFGVEPASRRRADLLQELRSFLETRPAGAEPTALVIDEAQNLPPRAFEDLRLLTNIETPTAKLLQIVLVGQPELAEILGRRSLRHVADRVAFHCRIRPLGWRERRNYVRHRLACVGGSPDLFTAAALWLLFAFSRGIPRRINVLGHTAMLFAYGRGQMRVTAGCVRSALREREAGWSSRRALGQPVGMGWVSAIVLLASAALAPLWWRASAEAPAIGVAEIRPQEPKETGDAGPSAAAGEGPSLYAADAPLDMRGAHTASDDAMDDPVAIAASADLVCESIRADTPPSKAVRPPWTVVRVRPGTTLSALAARHYGTISPAAIARIKAANPSVRGHLLLAGDTIRVPNPNADQAKGTGRRR